MTLTSIMFVIDDVIITDAHQVKTTYSEPTTWQEITLIIVAMQMLSFVVDAESLPKMLANVCVMCSVSIEDNEHVPSTFQCRLIVCQSILTPP